MLKNSGVRIAIIGVGNMGSALASGLQKNKVSEGSQLTLSDPTVAKLSKYKKRWRVNITSSNRKAVRGVEAVILAVKPQVLRAVVLEIKEAIPRESLIISVAAGVTIGSLKEWFKRDDLKIIRVMPNLPAKVGLGISGWVAAKEVSKRQKDVTRKILGSLGEEIEFASEADLDKVTAISGSGPAYFYYFSEGLIEAAMALGFSKDVSQKLVLETFFGSGELLKITKKEPWELRAEVTSKGGTTEAAIKVFEENNLKKFLKKAVAAAYRRAQELSS